jgi:hypothetical protein
MRKTTMIIQKPVICSPIKSKYNYVEGLYLVQRKEWLRQYDLKKKKKTH